MKERYFDSFGNDSKQVHRLPYQLDCGAIHAIGNGEIMIYGRGPEWMQCLGAPYSSPVLISLVVPQGDRVQCTSHRRVNASSWEHCLDAGTLTDLASREWHCVARQWALNAPVRFLLDAHGFSISDVRALFPGCAAAYLIATQGNTAVYNDYPVIQPVFMLAVIDGTCGAETVDEGALLTLNERGVLRVCGGQDYPKVFEAMRAARQTSFDTMLLQADADDAAFLKRAAAHRSPLADKFEAAIEDALLMIRAQQSNEGGIQAGHNYHLGYVRDQYGDSRGLLAMGAYESARAILEFYRSVHEKHGFIANAQAMGVDGVFHIHENDLTEITGYLLLQGTDYLTATDDAVFFQTLVPMLDWALKAQIGQLHNGMMPFNGDETYIAGGIVPRTILNHGSFEATMLLITGGRRYLEARSKVAADDAPWIAEARAKIDEAARLFEANFRRGSDYAANAFTRTEGLTEPAFRHGVCLSCGHFGWQHRVSEGAYVCANCVGKAVIPPNHKEYRLKSTLLMAPFIGSELLDRDYLANQVSAFLEDFRANHRLPSLPDGSRCLGYDYGLMLFAAAATGINADDLLERMLALQDECGAWSEYYDDGQPKQTRCRPWESAINIAGAIEYLKS